MNQNYDLNQTYNYGGEMVIPVSPFVLYTFGVLLVYILPQLKVSVPYFIAGSLMLLYVPIVWNKNRGLTNYIIFMLFAPAIIIILDILLGFHSFTASLNEAIRNIRFFVPVLLSSYAIKYCTNKQCKHLLLFFSIITAFVFYRTSNALANDPWITRIMAKSSALDTAEMRAYRLQNIGGFEFSYMIGVVTICLVWIVINSQKKIIKVFSLVATVICFNYIIQTMYTTLLLLTSFCILVLFLFNIKNRNIKIILVVVFIALFTVLPSLFEYLSTQFGTSLLATKFSQLHDAMTGEGIKALGSRPEKILFALKSWLRSPIFGGITENVNAHSLVVGTLVSNGLVGLGVWVSLFYLSYKVLINKLVDNNIDTTLVKVACLFVFVLSFLNPIGYVFEVTIAAFFIAPMCSWVIYEDESIYEKYDMEE